MTKTSKWGTLISGIYLILGALILIFQPGNVWGNLEASFLLYVPGFTASHVIINRKIENSKQETHTLIRETNDNRSRGITSAEGIRGASEV